jgi:hypothetical protein
MMPEEGCMDFTLIDLVPFVPAADRRARRPLPRSVRACVWDMTRGRCWYCGTHCNPFESFVIDHVVPLARGGDDDISNLVPCCAYCNARKNCLLLDEWRECFARAVELDEAPWVRSDRRFWFEGGDLPEPFSGGDLPAEFIRQMRDDEIRVWRRVGRMAR